MFPLVCWQELESDSENGADVVLINQNQKTHLASSPHGSTSTMAGLGAKPKTGVGLENLNKANHSYNGKTCCKL